MNAPTKPHAGKWAGAMVDDPTMPRVIAWRGAISRMDAVRPPCNGFLAGAWPGVHAAMLDFIEEWGPEAEGLGFGTAALFGVHRLAGAIRADSTGALITPHAFHAVSVEPGLIRFANGLAFRGQSNLDESIPIWTFREDKPR